MSMNPPTLGGHVETFPGLIQSGNIDLNNRPIVPNDDGSFSTVRSITITGDKNRAILIPTVSDNGKVLSNEDAIKLYQSTGKHLGIFHNETAADAYAQQLHLQQMAQYTPLVDAMKPRPELRRQGRPQ